MARTTTQLFLSEADPHGGLARRAGAVALTGRKLRAYILQHALFFDQLVIGDSQFLTNTFLRSLIATDERDTGALQDLAALLDGAHLLPAVRDRVASLTEVWHGHRQQGIADLPSERYVDLVERRVRGRYVRYRIDSVSDLFRRRILDMLDPANEAFKLALPARRSLADYVNEHDPLLYHSLREWMRMQVEKGRLTPRQRSMIDDAVAYCYRHNVPLSLDINVDVPLPRFWSPVRIVLGSRNAFGPEVRSALQQPIGHSFVLSWQFLSQMPVSVLTVAKTLPVHRRVTGALERFRRHGKLDNEDRFVSDMEDYLKELDLIVAHEASAPLKKAYLRFRLLDKAKTVLHVVHDDAIAAAGFYPDPTVQAAASLYHLLYASYGAITDFRKPSYDHGYRHGYVAGRLNRAEPLLLQSSREGL